MKYEGKNRYQSQPWYVRLYRRLRHQPLSWLWFLWVVFLWALKGCPAEHDWSRRALLDFMWSVAKSKWTIAAGWWYTTEEAIGRLRK